MKRTIIILLAAFLLAGAAFAEDSVYSALIPKNAKSMGMGGVFSAVPTSEFSFFGNPAAFAAKKASYTLVSADVWAYLKPTSENIGIVQDAIKYDDYPALYGLVPSNGGLGMGTSVSLSAFAGRGLGLGVFLTTDEWAKGTSLPSVIDSDTEVSAVIGIGIPLSLGGLRLSVGGDLRPFYRVHAQDVDIGSVVETAANDGDMDLALYDIAPINAGFGLAMDLGAMLELGSLAVGASIRDIAPSFPVFQGSLGTLLDTLETDGLPETTEGASAIFLPNVSLGLSWRPALLKGFLEPSVYFEMQDAVSVFKNWEGFGSAVNLFHLGTEVEFLNFVYARAGLNRGWLSVGAGVDLLFLDVNASVFTEELGKLAGDKPRSGLALQVALRF